MIHWIWALTAFIVGALFGMFLAALIHTNRDDDR